MALGPGSRIDHYRILEPLGQGAFGSVYKVQDVTDGSVLAMKLLQADSGQSPAAMLKEGRALVAVVHPHIIRFRGLHPLKDGGLALLMDFAPGEDLGKFMARYPDPGLALWLLNQVAMGLNHAHALQVTHRDIKPANILVRVVDDEPIALISDFGLGREAGFALKSTANIAGTLPYMSPETLYGGETEGGHIDQWALAVTAYQLLSGGQFPFPFARNGFPDFTKRTEFTDVVEADEVAHDIERVFHRAFRADRKNRFPTCLDLTQSLGAATGVRLPTVPGDRRYDEPLVLPVVPDLPPIPLGLGETLLQDPNAALASHQWAALLRRDVAASRSGRRSIGRLEAQWQVRQGAIRATIRIGQHGNQRRGPASLDPDVMARLGFEPVRPHGRNWLLIAPVSHDARDLAERLILGAMVGGGVSSHEAANYEHR